MPDPCHVGVGHPPSWGPSSDSWGGQLLHEQMAGPPQALPEGGTPGPRCPDSCLFASSITVSLRRLKHFDCKEKQALLVGGSPVLSRG